MVNSDVCGYVFPVYGLVQVSKQPVEARGPPEPDWSKGKVGLHTWLGVWIWLLLQLWLVTMSWTECAVGGRSHCRSTPLALNRRPPAGAESDWRCSTQSKVKRLSLRISTCLLYTSDAADD